MPDLTTDRMADAIGTLTRQGTTLVKFTTHRPADMARRFYDMPDRATFEATLTELGLRFTTDAPQRGAYHGLVFEAVRYNLLGASDEP